MDTPILLRQGPTTPADASNLKLLFGGDLEELSNANHAECSAALHEPCTIIEAACLQYPTMEPPHDMDHQA